MIKQSRRVAKDRPHRISVALVVMLSALLMFGVTACSKTQEQDALGASQASEQGTNQLESEDSAATEGQAVPPQDLYEEAPQASESGAGEFGAGESGAGESGAGESATGHVPRSPQTSKIAPDEQRAAAQKLDGHWLLDAEATLALLPEESREGLREVFGQVRTGVNFSEEGDAIMNVISQGEKNEQAGKYAISDAKDDAVRIEFLIDDPALAEQDVRIFATVIFADEDTVHYQASTEENGRVVQREQIAVMKRVSPEKYRNVLKK